MAAALAAHEPDVVVVNAGGARFTSGDPITMTADDVVAVAAAAPDARVVAVHMEAINHCLRRAGSSTGGCAPRASRARHRPRGRRLVPL